MVSGDTGQWKALERWSPTLLLVGGGLVVGHATLRGIEAFTEIPPPPDVFGPPGYLLALVGLYGMYPALVDRTPRLARAAAAVATIPLVGWTLITALSVAEVLGVAPPGSGVGPGVLFAAHMAGLMATYLLFGAATLRAGVHDRSVGLLLLSVPVLLVALIAGAAVTGDSAGGPFLVGGALALVHLAVGATLRAGVRSGSEAPADDATTG